MHRNYCSLRQFEECARVLPVTGLIMHVHCNDECEVSVDGEKLGSSNKTVAWSSTIPRMSRLISIEASSADSVGSLYVGVSNGFQTNGRLLSR